MSLERVVDTLSGGEPSRHALDAARMATRQREVRYYAGAAAASGRGGSSAAAEGFQRRFGGTVDRNDRRFALLETAGRQPRSVHSSAMH